ncbi:NIF domain protein [Talaromyces stipitatus ATCC 10500]|uniref:NIF domain protein n=1 Tax=Talaromyces stipitatus (strain ATCC 10500 / CBS 375.48 / QM 6759 / NRRL 1006) TaxID=441959 RepID=B8LVE9_TALSN|nr:NIF domain protein [Talaromyces stipitatus ATCC 10500]EED23968.1 NIF domain protein [Talaromyces stipitatus ATCC 10500]
MNSLNILSSRVIGQVPSSTTRNRSHSQSEASPTHLRNDLAKTRSYSEQQFQYTLPKDEKDPYTHESLVPEYSYDGSIEYDEKSPLIHQLQKTGAVPGPNRFFLIAQKLFDAIYETIQTILSAIAAPGVYIAQTFRDDDGHYSPIVPFRKVTRYVALRNRESENSRPKKTASSHRLKGESEKSGSRRNGASARRLRSSPSQSSIASSTSESDGDRDRRSSTDKETRGNKNRLSEKDYLSTDSNNNTPRRSIRIKLHNDESLKRQKKRSQPADVRQDSAAGESPSSGALITAESLKSPISQSASHHRLTKYPHAPAPPRPLVPLRQPSYTMRTTGRQAATRVPQKTLVLDLDETLIHSLAKGGRMSSGHMVEVKLAAPVSVAGETTPAVGPQHPILYYVHKRPHCDEFLRKVCKWYRLVIFTASVQEYADPVIDWLEQERKFFQARYYRQHCTLRHDAFIKDLSSVEPDLSKVMILDNSPTSYIFHEDNAIPIKGWISDPTDSGLLNLIPMLEALQYVTDVRAFLALRRGEAES